MSSLLFKASCSLGSLGFQFIDEQASDLLVIHDGHHTVDILTAQITRCFCRWGGGSLASSPAEEEWPVFEPQQMKAEDP